MTIPAAILKGPEYQWRLQNRIYSTLDNLDTFLYNFANKGWHMTDLAAAKSCLDEVYNLYLTEENKKNVAR